MPTPFESADLILKLYELRREETMRKARDFMFGFNPDTVEELQAGFMGPHSGYIRMVLSYWEMAATFVVNGAIDAKLFDETNGEHVAMFSKVEPFLEQLRAAMGGPRFLHNLEKVAKELPGPPERVAKTRERMRGIAAMLKAAAEKQS